MIKILMIFNELKKQLINNKVKINLYIMIIKNFKKTIFKNVTLKSLIMKLILFFKIKVKKIYLKM